MDAAGHYAGVIDIADLHDRLDRRRAGRRGGGRSGARRRISSCCRRENIRSALARFDSLQVETLPVLLSRSQKTVVGYVTEAYALKRYSAGTGAHALGRTWPARSVFHRAFAQQQDARGVICPLRTGHHATYIRPMRPETQRSIDDIQQAIALLRRHL